MGLDLEALRLDTSLRSALGHAELCWPSCSPCFFLPYACSCGEYAPKALIIAFVQIYGLYRSEGNGKDTQWIHASVFMLQLLNNLLLVSKLLLLLLMPLLGIQCFLCLSIGLNLLCL